METALALGIVSFALVTLLGTLPIGLQSSRAANDLNITALIGQRMVGLVQQTAYSSYGTLSATYYYFDVQGQPLKIKSSGVVPDGALYAASILPAQTTNATLIGDDITANSIAVLQISIAADPAHLLKGTPGSTLPANPSIHAVTIPVFMANNGG